MSAADNDLQALESALDRHAHLRRTLHGVQQRLEQVDSFVSVSSFALRAQACDIDVAVAAVLDAAANAVQNARESLVLATLDSGEKLDLRSSLAAIRDKLLNAGGQGGGQPELSEDATPPRHVHVTAQTPPREELLRILDREHRSLQRLKALLLAVKHAVDHEAEGLDPADAVDGTLVLVQQSLDRLDRWEAAS